MSDTSPGSGWWLASDGKWYPPKEADEAPGPGWWLASDGKWYPPKETDEPPGPGWWLASDGKWYAPEARANGTTTPPGPRSPEPSAQPSRPPVEPAPTTDRAIQPKPKTKASRRGRGRRGRGKADAPPPTPEVQSATPTAPAKERKPAPRPEPAAASGSPSTRLVTGADGPSQHYIRPNLTEGLTPLDQIERRNQASRADASVQAAKRAAAASRALGRLQAQIDIDRAEAAANVAPELTPLPPVREPKATPVPVPASTPEVEPEPTPAAPVQATVSPAAVDAATPLLEVKTSPLGADLEHLGDRLAIFVDRVELRDRLDRVRNSINGDDIVDVVVDKRVTGAVLTVESVRGAGISAKGLRPDQADEARQLILAKTRPARLAGPNGDNEAAAGDEPTPPRRAAEPKARPPEVTMPKSAAPKIDAVALRSKLADLHLAGVLTDDEYQQKLLVVRRLAKGETRRAG